MVEAIKKAKEQRQALQEQAAQKREAGRHSRLAKKLGVKTGQVDTEEYQINSMSGKEEEVKESEVKKQQEKATESLEFGGSRAASSARKQEVKDRAEEIQDEKKRARRLSVSETVGSIDSSIRSSESNHTANVKKKESEKEKTEDELSSMERKLELYYETPPVRKSDGTYGANNSDRLSDLSDAQKTAADNLIEQLNNKSQELKKKEDELKLLQDEGFVGGDKTTEEVRNLMENNTHLNAVKRKEMVKDLIKKMALKELNYNGKVDPEVLYNKYFRTLNTDGTENNVIKGFFTKDEIKNIAKEITENTTKAKFERAYMQMVEQLDEEETDPLDIIDTIIETEKLPKQQREDLLAVAKEISIKQYRSEGGDVLAVVEDPGVAKDKKVDYLEAYIRDFSADSFVDDMAAIKNLRDKIRSRTPADKALRDRLDELSEKLIKDAGKEMASGDSSKTLTEILKEIDDYEKSLPGYLSNRIEARFREARFDNVAKSILQDYVDGRFTLDQLGYDVQAVNFNTAGGGAVNFNTINVKDGGILDQYIKAGDIDKKQAREIARMVAEADIDVSETNLYGNKRHEVRMKKAVKQATEFLEQNDTLSKDRKTAERLKLEGLKFISDVETDKITGFFKHVDRFKIGWYSFMTKFGKYGKYFMAGISIGGLVGLGAGAIGGNPGLMLGSTGAIAGGGVGVWGLHKLHVNSAYRRYSAGLQFAERAGFKDSMAKMSKAYEIINNENFTREQAQIALKKLNLDPGLVDTMGDAFDLSNMIIQEAKATQERILEDREIKAAA